jgi:hypothetical protein
MARRKSRNNRSNKNQVKKNTLAQAKRNITRNMGRAIGAIRTKSFAPLPFTAPEPAKRVNRTPPEREIAKRKKPITKWSDKNLRLRCKDRPKNNKPNGAGGGQKEYVPWC